MQGCGPWGPFSLDTDLDVDSTYHENLDFDPRTRIPYLTKNIYMISSSMFVSSSCALSFLFFGDAYDSEAYPQIPG